MAIRSVHQNQPPNQSLMVIRVAACPLLSQAPSLGQSTSHCCPTQGRTRHRLRETVLRPLRALTRTSLALGRAQSVAPRKCSQATRHRDVPRARPLALGKARRVVTHRRGARG
ncbi:hypothetical protein PIB30_038712 [Stylosanthes scabra]|uniref:Uncharacterized protein n=1 Tax=Stylosanthes scabra TaxID=79078 RepID=A0ABU6RE72_9FABA|nr:hypothetical protein [Stylosanthes scabra]